MLKGGFSPNAVKGFNAWQKAERIPFGYELCFKTEEPLDVLERLERVQDKNGPRIWINTLWDSLCAGHTDERGFNGDPAGSWGWCLDRKATIIQTDRPKELITYYATVDAAGNLSGESAVRDPADSTGTAWDSGVSAVVPFWGERIA